MMLMLEHSHFRRLHGRANICILQNVWRSVVRENEQSLSTSERRPFDSKPDMLSMWSSIFGEWRDYYNVSPPISLVNSKKPVKGF